MRSTWIQVSLDALQHNVSRLRSLAGPQCELMAVVKANAYGHGAIPVSSALVSRFGIRRLAVATAWEAKQILSFMKSSQMPSSQLPHILVLGSLPMSDIPEIVEMSDHVEPTVSSNEVLSRFVEECRAQNAMHRARVHLKLDSGMGRVGYSVHTQGRNESLVEAYAIASQLGLRIGGLYTHFADSSDDAAGTELQLQRFVETLRTIAPLNARIGHSKPIVHVANSGAILRYGRAVAFDCVRPGIAMYGLDPGIATPPCFDGMDFQPLLSVLAQPTLVKTCEKGDRIGYGGTYTVGRSENRRIVSSKLGTAEFLPAAVDGKECIATFSFGYADGFSRAFSNRAWVRHSRKGILCPVVGRVSMDQVTVRVPEDTTLNDIFELVTADYDPETSISGRANILNSISYEGATSLANRIPRLYTLAGEVVDQTVR
eukprot:ANDGO_01088.mRNA.1 Alanine racemase